MIETNEEIERLVDKMNHLLDNEDNVLKVCMFHAMDMTKDGSEPLRNMAKSVIGLYLVEDEKARRNAFVHLVRHLANVKTVSEWDYGDERFKDLANEKFEELAPWYGSSALGMVDGKRFVILSEEEDEIDFFSALGKITSRVLDGILEAGIIE